MFPGQRLFAQGSGCKECHRALLTDQENTGYPPNPPAHLRQQLRVGHKLLPAPPLPHLGQQLLGHLLRRLRPPPLADGARLHRRLPCIPLQRHCGGETGTYRALSHLLKNHLITGVLDGLNWSCSIAPACAMHSAPATLQHRSRLLPGGGLLHLQNPLSSLPANPTACRRHSRLLPGGGPPLCSNQLDRISTISV